MYHLKKQGKKYWISTKANIHVCMQVNADGKICANVRLDSSARIARLCMCPNGDVWILSHGGKKHPTKIYWCQSGGGGESGVCEITAVDQSILNAIK